MEELLKNSDYVSMHCPLSESTKHMINKDTLSLMNNVLLTPHMGWKGLETRQRLVSILADNIKKFIEGNPINVVSGL